MIETVEDQQMSTSCKIELHTKPVGMVFADRDRVGQVITNLLTNAIKYAPNTDKIVVEIKAEIEKIRQEHVQALKEFESIK